MQEGCRRDHVIKKWFPSISINKFTELTALGTADKINRWLFAEMYFILIFFMENSNLLKEEKTPHSAVVEAFLQKHF